MTLEEAIKHCEEKADCTECGKEHQQLAHWLKELACFRKAKEEYYKEYIKLIDSDMKQLQQNYEQVRNKDKQIWYLI